MDDKKVFVIKLISLLVLFVIFLQLFISGLMIKGQENLCENMETKLVIDQETGKRICLDMINIPICNNMYGEIVKESYTNINFSYNNLMIDEED